MYDGSLKNIEDLSAGERVSSRNGEFNEVEDVVGHRIGSRSTYMINGKVEATPDHPFLSTDGLKVADAGLFYRNQELIGAYGGLKPTQLEIGDILLTPDGYETVVSIEELHLRQPEDVFYDLLVDGDNTYVANGLVTRDSQ